MNLEDHYERWADCEACPLHLTRSNVVLFRGSAPCKLLFVGEAPGPSENALGRPFVGPAGKLLDKLIAELKLSKTQTVGISNTIACYPRQGQDFRAPTAAEIKACRPRLDDLIRNITKPRYLITLGKVARPLQTVYKDIPSCNVHHPAYLLRLKERGTSEFKLEWKRSVLTIQQLLDS